MKVFTINCALNTHLYLDVELLRRSKGNIIYLLGNAHLNVLFPCDVRGNRYGARVGEPDRKIGEVKYGMRILFAYLRAGGGARTSTVRFRCEIRRNWYVNDVGDVGDVS